MGTAGFRAATAAAASVLVLSGAACGRAPEPAPVEATPAVVSMPVSQNQMMVSLMDFAADGIWRPADPDRSLSAADWRLVQNDAVALAAATSLLSVPSAGGERDANFLADPDWRRWTLELQAAAVDSIKASEQTDKDALRAAGDRVVEVCRACHAKFKPDMPGGGVTRYPEYPKPARE